MTAPLLDRDRIQTLFDLRSDVYESRGGGFDLDPNPVFHQLRQSGPVHAGAPHEALGWTGEVFFQGLPYPDRLHFSAYDFQSCSTILRDDQHFVTSVPPLPGEPALPDAAILFMDGKRHRNYRTLMQPSFVPGRARWWLENWVSTTVHQLIDAFEDDRAVDLNIEFCAPIPLLTITGSFGITIDEALDVRAAVTSDGQGGATLARLLLPIIAARREQPLDDVISVLVDAEITDEDGIVHRLSDTEILGFGFLLLAAGSGTTWKQMGITLVALLRHPEALAAVREDRAFLLKVIEESVRWAPTDPAFSRFVAEDCELGGIEIPAGAIVHACLAAANRDPVRWERPDDFDPFRPSKPHLGFGHGPHTCLGMHVAPGRDDERHRGAPRSSPRPAARPRRARAAYRRPLRAGPGRRPRALRRPGMRLLDGKSCVITGAGSGVGRATAVLFAQHGASVTLGDVRDAWAIDTVRLVEDAGGKAVARHCDVSVEGDVEALVAGAVAEFGRLDILHNNAGISTPKVGLAFVEHTQADWDRLLGINLMGMVYGCKHAVLQFRHQGGGGVIVNTGSVAGMVGFGGVPYGVSKAGGILLTKSLAMEVAKEGIRVNAIAPATLLTNFGRPEEDAFRPPTQQEVDLWGSFVPSGRASTPEDCANAALFLASDLSANTTGAIIPVDGGYLAR